MKKTFLLSILFFLFIFVGNTFAATVFFIQGNADGTPPSVSDATVIAALTAKGYTVIVVDDDAVLPDLTTADAIVISSSVGGAKVTKYAWVTQPVIIWETAAYVNFGLAASNGSGIDNIASKTITFAENTHPMQTGFTVGDNVIFTDTDPATGSAGTFTTVTPNIGSSKPVVILATYTDATKPAWVLWEKGADIFSPYAGSATPAPTDGLLPGIRVVVPFSNTFFAVKNDLGMKMILNSVEYAITGKVAKPSGIRANLTNTPCSVYPNPAKNLIYVKAKEVKSISIYNNQGSLVMKVINDFTKGINVAKLPAGAYYIRTTTNEGTASSKLIKE